MAENREKIRRAEKVTDVVTASFREAQKQLDCCWVNGAGVLADPNMTHSRLCMAAKAIEAALSAMRGCSWPSDADYGE